MANNIDGKNGWKYCAAFDGDADRIVFFEDEDSSFFLLDGDKIAVLICEFLQAEVAALGKACQEQQQKMPTAVTTALGQLRLGAVQTAYANGALRNI